MSCPIPFARTLAAFLPIALVGGVSLSFGIEGQTFGKEGEPAGGVPTEQLVREALSREAYGLQKDRARLLQAALEQDPDYAPARWHQGYIRFRGDWIRAGAVPERIAEYPLYRRYELQREQQADDLRGNLQMADWCRRHQLPLQERAHWTRVLDFAPDHAAARSRLGYRMIGGQWKSDAELRDAQERREAEREALVRWRPRIERLSSGLRHPDEQERANTQERIREIADPAAIPALIAVLGSEREETALLAVETISRMQGQEAVEALVRQAVLSRWPAVRQASAGSLGQRKPESYVPLLLPEMYTPVQSQTALLPVGDGRLLYRHAFLREGQDQRQMLVWDTQYQRDARPGGDGRETLSRMLLDSWRSAAARQRSVDQQNRSARLLNQRIVAALNVATGQQLPVSSDRWWQWWQDEQDVVMQGPKQTRRLQRTTQVAVTDRVQLFGASQTSPRAGSAECFGPGTPVWTASGLLPIEEVRVGDLVLSQNVETGELAYKPVLRTTVRPAERLVQLEVSRETFETSGGHLFWSAGDGWIRSRDLQSGMQLHGLLGAVPVYEVRAGTSSETFNLAVADFHTYFVGDTRLLSHDVTEQRPTQAAVPGLLQR